jgi:hypothetical protein
MAPEVVSPGVKRPELEGGHPILSSAEINVWSYTFNPPYVFLMWCKYKDKFISSILVITILGNFVQSKSNGHLVHRALYQTHHINWKETQPLN